MRFDCDNPVKTIWNFTLAKARIEARDEILGHIQHSVYNYSNRISFCLRFFIPGGNVLLEEGKR